METCTLVWLIVGALLAWMSELGCGPATAELLLDDDANQKLARPEDARYESLRADNPSVGDEQSSVSLASSGRTRKRYRPADTPAHIQTIMNNDYDLGVLEYVGYIERQANCTLASLAHFTIDLPEESMYGGYERQMDTTVNTANILGSLFQTAKTGKQSRKTGKKSATRYDEAFYFSLVRSLVEGDRAIFGSVVAFRDDLRGKPSGRFCPYAYRDRQTGKTVIRDLGKVLQYTHNQTAGCEWYRQQRYKDFSHLFEKTQGAGGYPLAVGKASNLIANVSLILASRQDGQWSRPYVNCAKGPNWIVTYSVPFFGLDTREFM